MWGFPTLIPLQNFEGCICIFIQIQIQFLVSIVWHSITTCVMLLRLDVDVESGFDSDADVVFYLDVDFGLNVVSRLQRWKSSSSFQLSYFYHIFPPARLYNCFLCPASSLWACPPMCSQLLKRDLSLRTCPKADRLHRCANTYRDKGSIRTLQTPTYLFDSKYTDTQIPRGNSVAENTHIHKNTNT